MQRSVFERSRVAVLIPGNATGPLIQIKSASTGWDHDVC
jgi:hypothetical protein